MPMELLIKLISSRNSFIFVSLFGVTEKVDENRKRFEAETEPESGGQFMFI